MTKLNYKKKNYNRRQGRKSVPYVKKAEFRDIIQRYQNAQAKEKNDIYNKEVHDKFKNMAEFWYSELVLQKKTIGIEENMIVNDAISHAWLSLEKFDLSRETNPFSYFNLIIRNCVNGLAKKAYLDANKCLDIDDETTSREVNSIRYDSDVMQDMNKFKKEAYLESILERYESDQEVTEEVIRSVIELIDYETGEGPDEMQRQYNHPLVTVLLKEDPELVASIIQLPDESFTDKGLRQPALNHLRKTINEFSKRRLKIKHEYS